MYYTPKIIRFLIVNGQRLGGLALDLIVSA